MNYSELLERLAEHAYIEYNKWVFDVDNPLPYQSLDDHSKELWRTEARHTMTVLNDFISDYPCVRAERTNG